MKHLIDATKSKFETLFCARCERDTQHHVSHVRDKTYYVCRECGTVVEVQR